MFRKPPLKRALLCGSVLSSAIVLAATAQAACIDTANGTQCTDGTSTTDLVYVNDNPLYVAGDFVLDLNNFQVDGAGVSLYGVSGNSTVTLANGSSVTGGIPAGFSAAAVYAHSANAVDVSVNLLDTSSVDGTANGIMVENSSSSASQINVLTGTGAVIGRADFGIHATSFNSDISINTGGQVSGGLGGILVDSVYGDLEVTTADLVSGVGERGILANSIYSDVTVNAGDDVIGTDGLVALGSAGVTTVTTAADTQITGTAGVGLIAFGGSIDVDAHSDITGTDLGLFSVAFSGPSIVKTHGKVTSSLGSGIVIRSVLFSSDASLQVQANGDVTGALDGIRGFTFFSGDVIIEANAHVMGSGGNGITGLNFNDGDVIIKTGAQAIVEGSAFGIVADANGGVANISNNGVLRGNSALFARSFASVMIDNSGTIENLSAATSDLAIQSIGSPTLLTNALSGVITGRIEMDNTTAQDDLFTNAGLWRTGGLSVFGGGFDQLSNDGTLRFGSAAGVAEAAVLLDLEWLSNAGELTGIDQVQGDGSSAFDALELSGNYQGDAGAVLALDAFVSGPGSQADVFTVLGSTAGSTAIKLNNLNNGPADINVDGILLVDVKGGAAASDFYLADGPISAGLFDYALNFQASAAGNQFLLQSAQGAASHETVVAVDAVQALWQGGAEAWRLHQAALRDEVAGGVQIEAVADPVIAETQNSKVLWANFRGDWAQRSTANAAGVGYNQQTFGLDGGADFVMDTGSDQKIMFGIVAGYQTSQLGFEASANGIEFEGGSLGAHAGFISHGFFADVLVKQDWLALDYTLAGTGTASTNARTFGVSGDLGYRFGVASSFIEPMVSFASSKTTIGDFVLGSGLVSPDANTNTRVGAGVRVGFNDETYSLAVAARLWQGLDKGNAVNVSGTGLGFVVSNDGISHGVAGELSGKFAVNLTDASQIFAAGSLQLSEDGNSQSVNGGLQFNW